MARRHKLHFRPIHFVVAITYPTIGRGVFFNNSHRSYYLNGRTRYIYRFYRVVANL